MMLSHPERIPAGLVHKPRDSLSLGEYAGQIFIREVSVVCWRRVLAAVGYIHVAGKTVLNFVIIAYVSSLWAGNPIKTKSHGKSFARAVVGSGLPPFAGRPTGGVQKPDLTSLVASTRSIVLFRGSRAV
jgi:hypothetical protein